MEYLVGIMPLAIEPAVVGWFVSGSLFFGILGFFLAGTRGNSCWGCLLGLILGPFGLILAMLIPERR